ncbi:MAG: hypothetical protein IJA84_03655 [Clostridia bacterium]|nr:hypothetical protein [Clostridia bacterium]
MAQRTKRTVGDIPGLELHWSSNILKWIGFVCILFGTFSTAVIQLGILGLDLSAGDAALAAISESEALTGWANVAAGFAMVSYVALPIYAKLACEGACRTTNSRAYLIRLVVFALICEIPYDLTTAGVWLNLRSQNPVWAVALAVLMLTLFRTHAQPGPRGSILQCLVMLMAAAWVLVLRSQFGIYTILLSAMFYIFSFRKTLSTWGGALVCLVQFPAPMGMFAVHWYDGDKGKPKKHLFYILYLAQLVVFAAIAMLLRK